MNSFQVEGIPHSSYFTRSVYIDPGFIVAAPETPFTAELAKTISDWGFSEIYSEGEPKEDYTPDGLHASDEDAVRNSPAAGDLDKIQKAEHFYESLKKFVEILFAQAAVKNGLNFKHVAENVKNICDYVRDSHRYLMRAYKQSEPVKNEDYLVSHTVYSTVIAIIIGIFLKLPSHRLIELGTAALVHEIGMVKLPLHVYLANRQLNDQEKELMYTHPVHGYNIAKASNFPLSVCLAVLEHHERENGSGYPQKLTGDKISLYSKIIAVSCSYEAISSKRPHKEAKDGYTGMLELLKNEGKQYNETVVRALIYSLSIYPIGTYVLLSSGKKGQVIDGNPEDPRYPVVQILQEFMPDGKNKTIRTSAQGLTIVSALKPEEIQG